MWARTKNVLASCRRIALLLMLCLVVFVAWLYWHAPPLSEMRPELEALLKVQLHLKAVRLGHLSWYWTGHTWATVDHVSFTSEDGHLQVNDAELAVQLSTWDLLAGRITPTSATVRRGRVSIQVPEDISFAKLALPPITLGLKDVELAWRYGRMHGLLRHLSLQMDGVKRTLEAQSPAAALNISLAADMAPSSVEMTFRNLDWLPDRMRRYVHGQARGEMTLHREQARQWQADLRMHANNRVHLADRSGQTIFHVDTFEAGLHVEMAREAFRPERIEIQHADWHDGKDTVALSGDWQGGRLHLKLDDGALAMSRVWGWLRGMGGSVWQEWLQGMQAGRADGIRGELEMNYPQFGRLPDVTRLQQARYRLHAGIHDADITLGTSGDHLRHVDGAINLDEHGLQAHADRAQLPHNAGQVKGSVTIHDWHHVAFDIQGTGEVDAAALQSWLDTGSIPDLKLQRAPSTGIFSFHWLPEEDRPRQGAVTLVPSDAWKGEWRAIPVQMSGGEVRWSVSEGLAVKSMYVRFPIVSGQFDIALKQGRGHAWRLAHLKAGFSADFPKVVARYRLPLDAPQGTVHGELSFDGSWRGMVNLRDAAWRHLLGGNKQAGEPFVLHLSGDQAAGGMKMKAIRAQGAGIDLKGRGAVTPSQVYLNLHKLKAPAFAGGVEVTVPLDKRQPLEVNAQASFMDRQALPDKIPAAISERPWVLRAKVARLHWDAMLLKGVDVKLASSRHGVGVLQADSLDTSSLHVSDVQAFFRLPGKGRVDLRRLTAELLGQRLMLSATISPAPHGGLNWQGFASVEGEFSQVIQRLDASKLFNGGTVHALISGKGLLMPDQPWWTHLQGRLRLRADDGRILEGGTMSKLLAASSLSDLLHYLTLNRKDLTGPGTLYKHLQLEASLEGGVAHIRKLAMRASAMDIAGQGTLRLDNGHVDLMTVVRPLQNLDAILGAIPLLRDILGGAGRSVVRLVYHVYGPLPDAKVKQITPEEAGLATPGLLERMITLPQRWFSHDSKAN
ncbi:MAG TPA: AsmA-like C-terminal domain-containing protein [Mariprofundaceae bacterium]|nr:AsmA-like C-terminal domain-containing protein [Mariprofundaceae bacterium]